MWYKVWDDVGTRREKRENMTITPISPTGKDKPVTLDGETRMLSDWLAEMNDVWFDEYQYTIEEIDLPTLSDRMVH